MKIENDRYSAKAFEKFFANRIRELRNKNKISAREMSISLGQNVNYINLIENEKRMPSMQCFFLICEYFKITPSDFFHEQVFVFSGNDTLSELLSTLTPGQTQSIISMIKEFKNQ